MSRLDYQLYPHVSMQTVKHNKNEKTYIELKFDADKAHET